MAHGEGSSEVSYPFESFSIEDWENAYAQLVEKYGRIKHENRSLKKKINDI